MPIQFTCSCGRKLQAKEEHAGRRVKCPECGAEATVPGPDDAVQAGEPPKPKTSPVTAAESRRPAEDNREDDRPRRRSRNDDDEDDRPRRRSREEEDDRPRAPAGTSGRAIAALILGLLSVFFCLLTAVPAFILALLSLGDINRSRGRVGGKGLAIAGLIFSIVGTLLSGAGSLVYSVFKVREAASRVTVSNNMKQMTLGMVNDADSHMGKMMAPAICDKNGKPLLSWRVSLLPYIEQDALYRQFKLDEPWDGPNNSRLIAMMPKIYQHPSDPGANGRGHTHFRVFTGPQTPFPDAIPPFEAGRSSMNFPASFRDGMSNTILIVEAADAVPWTKPDELPYDPNKPLPKLGGQFKSGFLVGLADGSVRIVQTGVSDQTLRAAITPAGNDVLGPDW